MTNRMNHCLFKLSRGVLSIVTVSLFATPTLWGQIPPITDIAFAPDGKSLISCSQKGLQVFSWPELKLQKTVRVSFANLHCLEFSPNGKRLAIGGGNPSEEGVVEIFSWPACASLMKLSDHDDSVISVVWKDNTKLISAGLDRLLIQWDLDTEKTVKTYRGHSRGVSSACILQNGELVTAGHDQSVRVWNGDTGALVRSLNQHSKPVNSIAVCPAIADRPMVATAAGDRTIRFWQPTIGRMVRYVRLESEPLDIAWISESEIVASCVDGQTRRVDTENVKVLETIPVMKGWAYAVAAHPNDGTIAIAGSDGQLHRVGFQESK
ncbi:MAG: WD40 repeat domain-containing protein [Planctomycetaceae bacterium]|nr:WD40 repeat domain-containing protein [Planctomycetaceae bacterium]